MAFNRGTAQLQPLFNIHREQTATLNPAMPSSNYTISDFNNTLSVTYRYQWIGVQDAPITQSMNWETMLDDKNLLIGAFLLNDKTGDIGNTAIYARLAYKIVLSQMDKRFLSIGLNAGGTRFRANLSKYAAEQGIALQDKAQILPDLSIGAYYSEGNRFYAGVSIPQLLGNSLVLNDKVSVKRPQHIYGMAGFYIDAPFLGNDAAFLEPTAWIRYIPTARSISFDLNVRAKISPSFWVGVGMNTVNKSLNIETGSVLSEAIGLENSQLKIGFGFAVPMGQYWTAYGMGGEVHLSYSWSR